MRRGSHFLTAVGGTFLLALSAASVNGQVNVDLRDWGPPNDGGQQGASGAGTWNVSASGDSVLQTVNGAPTFFVSPSSFQVLDTTIQGAFAVETTGDDDFIGFVFGYQSPLSVNSDPVNDVDFLLLDWKQNSQAGASAGLRLSYVQGTHNGSSGTGNEMWPQTSNSNISFTSLGAPMTNAGWADNTSYDFTLLYETDRIKIDLEGGTGAFATQQTVFDVDLATVDPMGTFFGGSFPDGRFGFYNFSQASVRYEGFTQSSDPILSTTPADGGTLDLGLARVGTTTAPGTLNVANAGGPGSSLTGTISIASGEFAGPLPDNGFTLLENEDVDKTFTFAPDDRGMETQTIFVDSNDPADPQDQFDLAGQGVGPVFVSDPITGNTIDFGDVPMGATETLTIKITNDTPDPNDGDDDLTDLTLLAGDITGDMVFDLPSFVDGTVVHKGDMILVEVSFTPTDTTPFSATLTFPTDVNAPLGGDGEDFSFTLQGQGLIPEPSSLAIASVGLLLIAAPRRRTR